MRDDAIASETEQKMQRAQKGAKVAKLTGPEVSYKWYSTKQTSVAIF